MHKENLHIMSNLMVKSFYGEIAGRNIYSFLAKLDYDLKTSTERIEHLKKVLSDDKGNVHPFFERIFEQTHDEKTKLNTSYIKLILNTTDGLYSDTNVCEVITKLTDYVLFAEDMRELDRANKTEYKIYKDEVLFRKAQREISLEGEVERQGATIDGDTTIDDVVAKLQGEHEAGYDKFKSHDDVVHILVKDTNFKKSTNQVIYSRDYDDAEIGELLKAYQHEINKMNERLQYNKNRLPMLEAVIDSKSTDTGFSILLDVAGVESKEEATQLKIELVRDNKMLMKQIGLMKCDMIDVKELIKKPIRFKHLMSGSTKGDYTDVDFGQDMEEVIRVCMAYPEQETYDLQNEFDICLYIVRQLIEMTMFTVEEEQVLFLYQHGYTHKYIAEECSRLFGEEYLRQEVTRCLSDIAEKLINTYETFYTKYLINNNKIDEKGLKTCSKCGETKYRGEFDKDSSKKDGLKSQCKQCRKKG